MKEIYMIYGIDTYKYNDNKNGNLCLFNQLQFSVFTISSDMNSFNPLLPFQFFSTSKSFHYVQLSEWFPKLVFFIVLKTFCQDTSGIGHLGSGHCWWMDLFNHCSLASHRDQHYPPVSPMTLGKMDAPSLLLLD